jgi:hypothetical protein
VYKVSLPFCKEGNRQACENVLKYLQTHNAEQYQVNLEGWANSGERWAQKKLVEDLLEKSWEAKDHDSCSRQRGQTLMLMKLWHVIPRQLKLAREPE